MTTKENTMYNLYVKGKITLTELLEWHDKYMNEREVKNVA